MPPSAGPFANNPMNSTVSTPVVPNERWFLLTLAGIQFTHILDFMIMMPLGPQLIRVLHVDTHQFGLLLASYTLTAAISGLLGATYIDRFDRRKLMLTLYALFIGATLCCGLAPGYAALLAARALAGAFGGLMGAMVQTMVADVIPFERRGKAMGMVMASFSLSTVAGVPLGLFLADHVTSLGWRTPFLFIVAVSGVLLLIACKTLPSLTAHLEKPRQGNIFSQILRVAREPEHVRAFMFMSLMIMGGFTVIPYIALYTTANVHMTESFISLVYLCGGAATLVSSQVIGRMADKHGKLQTFRAIAALSLVPLLITTHLVPVPWWVVLINSTFFFVVVSGRMIPGMAMLTAVAAPEVRGTFMSLVSSVQMLSSGLATFIAGVIITRTPAGEIAHYNVVGYLAVICSVLAIWAAHRLSTHEAPREVPAGVEPGVRPN